MRGARLAELAAGPSAAVAEALDLVTAFDNILCTGLRRLDQQQAATLAGLAGAVAATPLGPLAAEAAEKIIAGSVGEEHLVALAAARTAVLGAVHDDLLACLDVALDRNRSDWPAATTDPGAAPSAPLGAPLTRSAGGPLAAATSWLTELAIAGWRGVGHGLAAAASQLLPALLAEPTLRRPALLLDGFTAELRASCPIPAGQIPPVRRWADLWARAMLVTQPGHLSASQTSAAPVSGRLLPLGVDVHEHATAVQAQVVAVFEPAGGGLPRQVRVSLSAAKVDTISGPALWQLLGQHPRLLAALAGRRCLTLTEMPLRPSGDLLWCDQQASPDGQFDPFALARVQLATATAAPVPPLERHPVRIAEPVLLEDYRASKGENSQLRFDVDGQRLPVATDRLPSCGPLTRQAIAASSACLGLLRWDGRWFLQPLSVRSTVKRQPVTMSTADWALGPTDPKVVKAEARTGDAVAVLRERAGRLLRR